MPSNIFAPRTSVVQKITLSFKFWSFFLYLNHFYFGRYSDLLIKKANLVYTKAAFKVYLSRLRLRQWSHLNLSPGNLKPVRRIVPSMSQKTTVQGMSCACLWLRHSPKIRFIRFILLSVLPERGVQVSGARSGTIKQTGREQSYRLVENS